MADKVTLLRDMFAAAETTKEAVTIPA